MKYDIMIYDEVICDFHRTFSLLRSIAKHIKKQFCTQY